MVIWFGSLEFISIGFSYDMILLSVRGLEGARVALTRSKATRRPHHRASPPKRRHDERHHQHPMAAARSPPHAGRLSPLVESPSALRPRAAAKPTSQGSNHRSAAPREAIPRVPSPPSALLPHVLFATRQLLLFGLDNAETSLTKTVRPSANAHIERPLALARSVTTQREVPSSAESPSFLQIRRPRPLGLGRYTLTTLRQ